MSGDRNNQFNEIVVEGQNSLVKIESRLLFVAEQWTFILHALKLHIRRYWIDTGRCWKVKAEKMCVVNLDDISESSSSNESPHENSNGCASNLSPSGATSTTKGQPSILANSSSKKNNWVAHYKSEKSWTHLQLLTTHYQQRDTFVTSSFPNTSYRLPINIVKGKTMSLFLLQYLKLLWYSKKGRGSA